MVTVKMVKDAGFDFAPNDRIITGTINKVSKRVYNLHRKPNSSKYYDDRAVDCFCFRDMTHHIDLNAGMIVDVVYSTNVETTCDAGLVNWGSVRKWRPSMQNWKIETPEEAEAFDIMAQDNEQLQNYEMGECVEWDGEGLPPVGVECELKYKHATNANWRKCKVFAYSNDHGSVAAVWHLDGEAWYHHSINIREYEFRKPETEADRKERERLEAAYDLYCEYTNTSNSDAKCYSQHAFSNLVVKDKWLRIVDKTGYRK